MTLKWPLNDLVVTFQVANEQVRGAALAIFVAVFPFQDSTLSLQESDELMQKQIDSLNVSEKYRNLLSKGLSPVIISTLIYRAIAPCMS